ncbi:MAG: hypothetical protein GX956_09120 [Firmicutes bacterium]|nr:hypothetical protein [Bacillota bacterium]
MKKALSLVLSMLMILTIIPHVAFASATPLDSLVSVEVMLYGQTQEGSLIERIERIETDIYGETKQGAVLMRIDQVQTFLQSSEGSGGLQLRLNLAEWGFSYTFNSEAPLIERLQGLETVLYGAPQPGNISTRAETLMMDIWGTTKLDTKKVTLPAQSLVKIALLKTIDSGKSQVGDVVDYKVVEDVVVEGRVVIPAGVVSQAKVTEVSSAGRLGKDGRMVVDFGRVASLDGTPVRLRVDERATQENKSLELAAGASMAGIVLLGPVGLAGGYFIKGKDVKIEANTQFYVETERAVPLSGFYFRPAQN